jgi:hypothetical protein
MGIIRILRVLLASRKLFRNWFSAGLKYYLSRYGLINVAVAGEDGFMDVRYSGGIDGGACAYTQAGLLGLLQGSDL